MNRSSERSRAADALAARMARAWQSGDRRPAEDWLSLEPELGRRSTAIVRLVCEELSLREDAGEDVSPVEFAARFPNHGNALRELFLCRRLLGLAESSPAFPAVGETLLDYRLVEEIGRGGMGRVFRAEERTLGGRPVILKLTPNDGGEHLSLARLQHTNIVPLYGCHDLPERGLRVLCMPDLGGRTLDRVLGISPAERTAADLGSPADLPYHYAVARLGAALADGLAYAHDRNLVHFDIKPANVLLTAEGIPLLLDFHLAREPVEVGKGGNFGGTEGYMSPEQATAWEAALEGRPVPTRVDARSDVYSLGLLLRETFVGTEPRGLRDVVDRCLAIEPSKRYPSAAALADDLRRHLRDEPLRGVPNADSFERWQKWRRRQPKAIPLLAARAAAVLAVVVLLAVLGSRSSTVAPVIPADSGELQRELDRVRERFGDPRTTRDRFEELERFAGRTWESRQAILGSVPADQRNRLRNSLGELALVWAEATGRVAEENGAAGGILDEVEREMGPSPIVCRVRQSLAEAAGNTALAEYEAQRASKLPARSGWEEFALGRWHQLRDEADAAAAAYARAVDLDPTSFAAWFASGSCDLERGRHRDAISAFTACIALDPNRAEAFYNRGLARTAAGEPRTAAVDFTRARSLNPNLTLPPK